MSLNCVIADTDFSAAKFLENFIGENTDWQTLAIFNNGKDAVQFINRNQIDILFLEVDMPGFKGMEMASLIMDDTQLVFTTTSSKYGAESYNYRTIDYVIKPAGEKRLLATKKKIENFYNARTSVQMASPAPDFFFVKSGKTLNKIQTAEILYFEGEKEYVRLVTTKEELLINRRLKDIQDQLGFPFVRIHNSYIVNITQLNKIQDNHVFIAGRELPISDKFKEQFMTLIHQVSF